MSTVGDIWAQHLPQDVDHLAVFRCNRRSVDAATYKRNRLWLPEGRTGWWCVDDHKHFDAIAVLLDSDADSSLIELWIGQTPEELDSGRFKRKRHGREWELRVNGPFVLVDVIKRGTMQAYFGRQIGNTVSHFERPSRSVKSSVSSGAARVPSFRSEFVGEKGECVPGSYTPDSKHGHVVLALYDWAKRLGLSGLNNEQYRDLQGEASDGRLHLFEVKTSACSHDIHTGVGQLIVYEARSSPSVKTLVLPRISGGITSICDLCKKIGISLLLYREEGDKFHFDYQIGAPPGESLKSNRSGR